ncbi:hypothetical protein BGW39_000695 [Mortierella sp. 14UC]|nr:hypothetical protein BGW39_000695 [Mortierella sp. 14UC]
MCPHWLKDFVFVDTFERHQQGTSWLEDVDDAVEDAEEVEDNNHHPLQRRLHLHQYQHQHHLSQGEQHGPGQLLVNPDDEYLDDGSESEEEEFNPLSDDDDDSDDDDSSDGFKCAQDKALATRSGARVVRQIDESSHSHAGNTQAAYKSTYRPYMEVCDTTYEAEGLRRYEVDEEKTAPFLSEKLFPASTKNIPTHIVKDMKVFIHREVIQAYDLKEVEKEKHKEQAKGQAKGNASTAAKKDKGDPKPIKVNVPYGVSRINQAYSAIIHLWTLQTSRLQQRSQEPAIRPSKLIEKTIDAYKRSLVGGILKAEHLEKDADGNVIKVGREVTTDN